MNKDLQDAIETMTAAMQPILERQARERKILAIATIAGHIAQSSRYFNINMADNTVTGLNTVAEVAVKIYEKIERMVF